MSIKRIPFALAVSGLLALTGVAQAQNSWDATHERHNEVIDRPAHQNERVREERREHEISAERAEQMHRQEHRTREEERLSASRDRGGIGVPEPRPLNQRDDYQSR